MGYTSVMSIISLVADGLMLPIVAVALYSLLVKVAPKNRYQVYSRVIIAGLTSYAAAKIIGIFFQPETRRPFELLGLDPGASFMNNPGFPSDHALLAVFLTITVWFVTRSRNLTILMSVMALAVCVGRVMALVHTPLDVIGGIVIALIGGIWYKSGFTTNHRKKSKKIV